MRMHGQRWEYRFGNHLVRVDNAFSFQGWAQERLVIDDETVRETSGWLSIFRTYREPWHSMLDEGTLHVALRSRLTRVDCTLTLNGELVPPTHLYEAAWQGPARSWPLDQAWSDWDGSWSRTAEDWKRRHEG